MGDVPVYRERIYREQRGRDYSDSSSDDDQRRSTTTVRRYKVKPARGDRYERAERLTAEFDDDYRSRTSYN
jgi:hypothetical protein